jgi:transposase-like protein
MLTRPTAYGAEFRQDVIDVARKGEAPLAQIAKDFGLSVTTLKRWIAIAERKESGAGPLRGQVILKTPRTRVGYTLSHTQRTEHQPASRPRASD